ncbi:MAG: Xaa-Pro peptidase family protein [Treponemataceae bacterium]|nr:Xaa-Pro peptidase family protein [Treponemataceae bacterium]
MTNLKEIYEGRRQKMAAWLKENDVAAVAFVDGEEHRSPCVRYFSGHPTDATLVIDQKGDAILIPWDENLAKERASVTKIIPLTRYERNKFNALKGALTTLKIKEKSKVEIPTGTSYPDFLHYVDALSGYDVLCREKGAEQKASELRMIKDEYEIACIRKAAAITDELMDMLEAGVRNGSITTESDAALLIEKECRARGCEGTGFDTLAAGPARSWAIHCFPPYTGGEFGTQGLSILDFGVVYEGYTSDCTMTFARGPLTKAQEDQLALVQQCYDETIPLYAAGLPVRAPAVKADEVFAAKKRSMPHSLGHSFGLECHEYPVTRVKLDQEVVFEPGMVITCEPGLYDAEIGGCRLENDVLITENGGEVITHSRIVRIDC